MLLPEDGKNVDRLELLLAIVLLAFIWSSAGRRVAELQGRLDQATLRMEHALQVLGNRGCAPFVKPETISPWPKPEPPPCVLERETPADDYEWNCRGVEG